MLTISDVLNMKDLERIELVAGEGGKNREIDGVNIVEVPEVLKWMKGKELLFSSGYIFHGNINDACKLIKNMYIKNIPGLVIKTGKYLEKIPKEMIDCANNLGFPLLKIPEDKPYSDYMNPINRYLINKRSIILEKINLFKEEVIPSILNDNYKEICEKIRNYTGSNVYCLNENGDLEFKSSNNKNSNEILHFLKEKSINNQSTKKQIHKFEYKLEGFKYKFIYSSIFSNVIHYLIIEVDEFENMILELEILEYLKSLISMEYIKKTNYIQSELNLMNEVFKGLLNRNKYDINIIYDKGNKLGLDFTKSFYIFKIVFFNLKKINYKKFNKHILDYTYIINMILKEESIPFLISERENEINLLLNIEIKKIGISKLEKILNRIINKLECENGAINIYAGISNVINNSNNIPKEYERVSFICKLAIKHKYNPFIIYKFKDFGIYKILYELKQNKEMNNFYYEELERIMEYDEKNNSDLLDTLKSYLKNNGSLIETSKELYIHKNTVSYRINKVSDLIGKDISQYDTILNLYLSIKYMELL